MSAKHGQLQLLRKARRVGLVVFLILVAFGVFFGGDRGVMMALPEWLRISIGVAMGVAFLVELGGVLMGLRLLIRTGSIEQKKSEL